MKLDEYLEALDSCPDDRLSGELGIRDNWPILLNADLEGIVTYLRESNMYKHRKTIEKPDGIIHLLDYVPGTVMLQIFGWIAGSYTTGFGCDNTEKERIESGRQQKDYNMTILLQPYQDRKMDGISDLRALGMVVADLGKFVISRNIPACMPKIGQRYYGYDEEGELPEEHFSRIVYHEPEV